MRLLIDADACPVTDAAIEAAKRHGVRALLLCDCAHEMQRDGAETIIVAKGADSADFRLVNLAQKGDLVVTQDYGLAAMCLAKRARVLHQDGFEYNEFNIDGLLWKRHEGKKARRAGMRTKGPAKRTEAQNLAFAEAIERLLAEMENAQ